MSGDFLLWRHDPTGRVFLLPDDPPLPPGDFVLRTGLLREEGVAEAAAAPYEVTREEARAFLDARLDRFVSSTKQAVEGWLAELGVPPSADDSPAAAAARALADGPGASSPSTRGRPTPPRPGEAGGPGVALFAALTGRSEEELAAGPDALVDAFAGMLRGVGDVLSAAAEGPEGRDALQAKLQRLGETLREHGIEAPPLTGEASEASDGLDPSDTSDDEASTDADPAPGLRAPASRPNIPPAAE